MPLAEKMQEVPPVILTFGGGIHARRRHADIDINECTDGQNFDLDSEFLALKNRRAFDLIGTAPNAGSINGFVQLLNNDGTQSTLVQAGGNVYAWDMASTFTLAGTCNPASKLRGRREHNFGLNKLVIITDINLLTPVQQWNGTTFQAMTNNLTSTFYAKYCNVFNERAFFGNVISGSPTPHLFLGSSLSDNTSLSLSNRPNFTLGIADPFYIPMPDLRAINGMTQAFGNFLISTSKGKLFQLTGQDSFSYALQSFYEGSALAGDESMANIGNDVVFGLPGRIETLSGTINYGDVETNDLSLPISPLITSVPQWTLAYDRRRQQVMCFPNTQDCCYVSHKSLINDFKIRAGGGYPFTKTAFISSWSKWVTSHAMDFYPTCVMDMYDPGGLDAVYMGDVNGNIYKLNGDGGADGGTAQITTTRTSKLFKLPTGGDAFDLDGWIYYRKQFPAIVTLNFLYAGVQINTQPITLSIPAGSGVAVYNGNNYYNDGKSYYGQAFSDRISRQNLEAAGSGDLFQIQVSVTGSSDFEIEEIGVELRTAKTT